MIDNNFYHAILNFTLDSKFETFTATVMSMNILLVQGSSTMIDLSLIIGNQIDTLLSGFLLTFTLYFYVARILAISFCLIFI